MRSLLRLPPGHISSQSTIGEALLAKGEPDAALASIRQESSEIWRLISLPMAYHALGLSAESDAVVAELIQKYETDAPYDITYVLAYRGEVDRGFAWLDKAVARGDPGLLDIAVQPELVNLRSDPRWRSFLRKLGGAPFFRFIVRPGCTSLAAGLLSLASMVQGHRLQPMDRVARRMEQDARGRRGPTWWMYLIGASYVVTFGFIVYLIPYGPAELKSFTATYSDGTMAIRSVTEGSPEWRGGLRAGDRVVAIDDRPIRTVRDWNEATGNLQVGRPQHWLVTKDGDRRLEIVPVESTLRSRLAEGYVQYCSLLFPAFAIGLLIGWKRPGDAVGRLGAWFMLTASMAFGFPLGWAVPWRALPVPIQGLLWITQVSRFVLEAIFLSFFLVFPRRLLVRPWQWSLIWVPVLLTVPWRVKAFYGVIHPGQVSAVPAWILQAGDSRTLVYLLAAIVVLAVSYRRLLDRNEKRRVRVLMVGTAASIVAAMSMVWIDNFLGRAHLREWNADILILLPIVPFVAACPLGMAYAILRHRVLGISVIVRQGLQYALARGAVLAVVPALAAVLAMDLASNREQTLAEIVRTRGWLYAAAAGLALAAYWKRREWLAAIDRRFFRERYDAQQVLRDVLEEIRSSRDFARVAPRVAERLDAAFHPEFVSVMIHSPDESEYRSLVSVPAGTAVPSLSAGTKLTGLLRVLGKPLEVSHGDSNWLDRQLPPEEADYLRHARMDVLVPIVTGSGGEDALLALGMKRSEEPYTREDIEFLEAIAASLSLVLERRERGTETALRAVPDAQNFQECPECGVCYESTLATCSTDGMALVPSGVPRILARRYRLDRRRGHGGMGTVYEASDSELERRVAVKLIREDWSDRVEALQRFRREARAAAGFSHPNVVTVYDYGVEKQRRAFMVMELLEGVTLRDELRLGGPLLPSRVVEILRSVCAAVEAAHRFQLIHRDLKPANIFLARGAEATTETVKVLDFGIAKFLPSSDDSVPTRTRAETESGVLVGTPAYMSPEQMLGEPLDKGWDLWALAVIAYEALTGALPFASAGGEWQRAVIAGRFTPLAEHLRNPRASWDSFFQRCFSHERSQRPGTAAEFFERLDSALA